jgi:hypothetical protein
VFTRHYQAAMTLAEHNDLIVTLPTRAALLKRDNPRLVRRDPPLEIPPLELKMAWSPLLQHNPGNRWLRKLIVATAREHRRAGRGGLSPPAAIRRRFIRRMAAIKAIRFGNHGPPPRTGADR